MRQVFDPENLFWSLMGRMVDFVGLSLLWAALCLPVVTIGPACAALYYTVVKCFRQREKGAFGLCLRAFRDNLRTGIPATLICLAAGTALFFGYGVMRAHWGTDLGAVLFVAYDVALLLPAGLVCWLFALLGRFSFPLGGAFRTAAMLALRHLPSTVVVVLMTLEFLIFGIERWWPVFFAPVLCALLSSLFFERVFPKYLTGDEREKLARTGETPVEEE